MRPARRRAPAHPRAGRHLPLPPLRNGAGGCLIAVPAAARRPPGARLPGRPERPPAQAGREAHRRIRRPLGRRPRQRAARAHGRHGDARRRGTDHPSERGHLGGELAEPYHQPVRRDDGGRRLAAAGTWRGAGAPLHAVGVRQRPGGAGGAVAPVPAGRHRVSPRRAHEPVLQADQRRLGQGRSAQQRPLVVRAPRAAQARAVPDRLRAAGGAPLRDRHHHRGGRLYTRSQASTWTSPAGRRSPIRPATTARC